MYLLGKSDTSLSFQSGKKLAGLLSKAYRAGPIFIFKRDSRHHPMGKNGQWKLVDKFLKFPSVLELHRMETNSHRREQLLSFLLFNVL